MTFSVECPWCDSTNSVALAVDTGSTEICNSCHSSFVIDSRFGTSISDVTARINGKQSLRQLGEKEILDDWWLNPLFRKMRTALRPLAKTGLVTLALVPVFILPILVSFLEMVPPKYGLLITLITFLVVLVGCFCLLISSVLITGATNRLEEHIKADEDFDENAECELDVISDFRYYKYGESSV